MENKLGFFKIISAPIMQDQELGLPVEFVKRHGKDFSNAATLEVPNGSVWKIQMKRVQGKLWFTSGWKEFVQHYSISVGHLVFFTYHGSCRFHVVICDMTAVEIKYGSKIIENPVPHESGESSMEVVEVTNEIPAKRRGRPRKNVKIMGRKSVSSAAKQHRRAGRDNGQMSPEWNPWAASRHRFSKEKSAIEAANAHTTQNPSFMVVMVPAYVQEKYALNVPFGFVKEHLGLTSQEIFLYVCNKDGVSYEKVWNVDCRVYEGSVKIYCWKKFCEDNSLRANDVCVFELVEMNKIVFKVSIFRGNND